VLELMATGSSNQGIADKLVITLRAVEKYVSSIFGKLGLPSTGSESRRVLAVLTRLSGPSRSWDRGRMLQTTNISYVGSPSIPAGMTVSEYRRSRPSRPSAWRRITRLATR
jgi:Bacterial regulatory proteins, luxR family